MKEWGRDFVDAYRLDTVLKTVGEAMIHSWIKLRHLSPFQRWKKMCKMCGSLPENMRKDSDARRACAFALSSAFATSSFTGNRVMNWMEAMGWLLSVSIATAAVVWEIVPVWRQWRMLFTFRDQEWKENEKSMVPALSTNDSSSVWLTLALPASFGPQTITESESWQRDWKGKVLIFVNEWGKESEWTLEGNRLGKSWSILWPSKWM